MSRTVLLVEDNRHIMKINGDTLTEAGYRVLKAETAAQARALLETEAPDLIVLDIMLPDGDGLALCRDIRGESNIPILFLSAKKESSEIIEGLRAGGDDYLPKPYDIGVLLARVEALLRRAVTSGTVTTWGSLTLDTVSQRALVNGEDILLTPREFALLLYLVRNEGQEVHMERLYEAAWGQPMANDPNAVRIAVSRLRKKIAPAGVQITTARGVGFVLRRYDKT